MSVVAQKRLILHVFVCFRFRFRFVVQVGTNLDSSIFDLYKDFVLSRS